MVLSSRRPHNLVRSFSWNTAWIGVGLGVLILNAWSSAVPVVTAMSLVALGATTITVERYRGKWLREVVVALNLAMYCGLYAIFFGATLHRAAAQVDHRLGVFAAIDLAASMCPMAVAFVRTCSALRPYEPTR
jgi:hypothetical protein